MRFYFWVDMCYVVYWDYGLFLVCFCVFEYIYVCFWWIYLWLIDWERCVVIWFFSKCWVFIKNCVWNVMLCYM